MISKAFLLTSAIALLLVSAACGDSISRSQMEEMRHAIEEHDPDARAALGKITRAADKALKGGPLSVTAKGGGSPPDVMHDYVSQAPYWWPDPDKKDGLPFIRKDGRVFPGSRGEHVDYGRKGELFKRLRALGQAAYLTCDPRYGKAAVELLETWFVRPESRMNPDLEHAQGIPGINPGRAAGIIEWCNVGDVTSSIELLRKNGALPAETDKALVAWFAHYADWLENSKIGREERAAKNNHGTWYDVQLVTILLFLDRRSEAHDILEEVKTRRIATQIEPDGSQPRELARTKSLSYSKMNLAAFKKLVSIGKRVNVDLWNFETPDGRGIPKAERFIEARTGPGKTWPYPQLTH